MALLDLRAEERDREREKEREKERNKKREREKSGAGPMMIREGTNGEAGSKERPMREREH